MSSQVIHRRPRWGPALLALLLIGAGAGAVRAAPCPPVLSLQGEAELVDRVGEGLRRRGLSTEGIAGCPTVLVRLDRVAPAGRSQPRAQQGVAVTVVEIVNEDSRREFGSVELALSFIESAARRDISGALLSGPEDPPPIRRPGPAPSAGRATVAAGATLAVDSGGRLLAGGEALGCGQVGRLCVGGLLSVRGQAFPGAQAAQTSLVPVGPGPPALLTNAGVTSRVDVAALVHLELPLQLPRVSLIPALGFGVTWQRAHLDYGNVPQAVVPLEDADQAGLRLRAGLAAAVPLGRGVALDLGVHADFSFLASALSLEATCAPNPGDTGPCAERRIIRASLPAPAWGLFSARVGVRWSGP